MVSPTTSDTDQSHSFAGPTNTNGVAALIPISGWHTALDAAVDAIDDDTADPDPGADKGATDISEPPP
jgi:hypothetical protein